MKNQWFAVPARSCPSLRRLLGRRTRQQVLAGSVVPLGLLLAMMPSHQSRADSIFAPGDLIMGGKENNTDPGNVFFQMGAGNGAVGTNTWPNGESPDHVIDGVAQKYLNFGVTYTGFLVQPSFNGGNGSVASSMQLWTANDSENRDPASYEIWGTNSPIDFSQSTFSLSLFSKISEGGLALPTNRNGAGSTALNNANSQTVTFANASAFSRYLILFPTVKNTGGAANSMQVAEVQLFGIAAFTSLIWTGANSAVWNVNTTQNFSTSGAPSTFSDTNGVTFDDTASAARTNITIQNGGAGIKPAVMIFQNNTLSYSLSGESITSPGSLAFNGTASVTLNNANSFANGTAVNAGTVNIGPTGSLGTNALAVNNLNTGAGTTVALNFASAQTVGSLSGSLATPASGTNAANINLTGTLTVQQSADTSFAGSITGTGGLTKTGNGALTLTGSSTYAGPTVVNAGRLVSSAPGDNPKGALPTGQPVTVNAGGTLVLGTDDGLGYYSGSVSSLTINGGNVITGLATHSTLPNVTMTGGTLTAGDAGNFSNGAVLNYILDGSVTTTASATTSRIGGNAMLLRGDLGNTGASNPITFNVARGSAAVDLAVTAQVLDQGAGLVKSGNGILALSNTNTYTGPTVVNGGTIALSNSSALGTGQVTLNDGTALTLGAANVYNGFATFALNGGATSDGNATLQLTTNAGNQAHSAFSQEQVAVDKGFVSEFVYTSGGNRAADGMTFTIQNSSPTAVGAAGGGLGYQGIANSAAIKFNLYTGQATPQPVGTNYSTSTADVTTFLASSPVNLASGNPIGVRVQYDPATSTLSETLTDLLTRATYTNTFTGVNIPAAIGGNVGYVGFTGGTGGATASQTVGNFSFNNYSQGIALTNNVKLANGASATLSVLPVSAGGAGEAFLAGTVALSPGSTLNVNGGPTPTNTPYQLTDITAATISGNASVNVANNGTGVGRVTLNDIQDAATGSALTKSGNGTLVLASAATYTGTTTVNAGTLVVNGSIAGSTAVSTGGTLAGTGTAASILVGSGGAITPGEGIGTLKGTSLSLLSGSSFSLEIGASNSDSVKLTGAGSLAGLVNLAISLLADPVDNTTFTILDGGAALSGISGGARLSYLGVPLQQNQQFTVTDNGFTQTFTISYSADAGRDITLVAIPEPGTSALALLGLASLAGWRRRRK